MMAYVDDPQPLDLKAARKSQQLTQISRKSKKPNFYKLEGQHDVIALVTLQMDEISWRITEKESF